MFGEIASLLPDAMEASKRLLLPALAAAAAIRVLVSIRRERRGAPR
jgi:hypothetical protein